MEREYLRDPIGNRATITDEGNLFHLICRDYNGKKWKDSFHVSAKAAKSALRKTGPGWKTTKGRVSDDPT